MSHPALHALIEERATPWVAEHLARCPRCRVALRLHDDSVRPPPGAATAVAQQAMARTIATIAGQANATLSEGLTALSAAIHRDAGPDPASFVPLELLGRGPQGESWTASRRGERQIEVLKALSVAPDDPDAVRVRFARLQAARHDALARLRALARTDRWYVVREFVPGPGPIEWLLDAGPLATQSPAERIRGLVRPLVSAIARLHAVGLAHGAVSLGNVRLRLDGRPVLTDPLLAAAASLPGDWIGLGALLHELLAGAGPEVVPLPPTVPGDLAALIRILGDAPCDAAVLRHTLDLPGASLGSTDRYRDQGLLGRGGMSEIRRVFDPVLGRTLALKIGPPPDAPAIQHERFLAEAQASAQLQHPGVVAVHDLGRTPDGRTCFTMDVIRGDTLTQIVQKRRDEDPEWPLRRIVRGLVTVCETLAYAHSCGVLHRDLKPDNVMVGPFGEAYVLDWGIAKVLDGPIGTMVGPRVATVRQGQRAAPTEAGQIIGTPGFMAPEVARGGVADATARIDVYGVGALLYFVLAGRAPHRGASLDALLATVRAGTLADVVVVSREEGMPTPPAGLVAICRRAMSPRPDARPDRVRSVGQALDAWLAGDAP